MDLETVIQSEVSQKENNKYRMLIHIYRFKSVLKIITKPFSLYQALSMVLKSSTH